jgi:GT2 family glycosyltransferase
MISIGVLTYKRNDDLIATLKTIVETSSNKDNIELIIVDNNLISAESDILSTIDLPTTWRCIYDHDGKNKGVAGGRNRIVELSTCEIIIFLDDDICDFDISDIIYKTNMSFFEEPLLGALAYKIIDAKTNNINDNEFPHKDKRKKEEKLFFSSYFIGAGHAIKRSCFDQVGGYPNDIGLYGMEEVDLSYRLISKGYCIKYNGDISITHKRSPSGRFDNNTIVYNAFYNKCLIATKYLKLKYFITHLIVWGGVYVIKTKNIKELARVYRFLIFTRGNRRARKHKFNDDFYRYCKKNKAWLWW